MIPREITKRPDFAFPINAGNFGLVIGVDRKGDAGALRDNGADIVVNDLGEIM